MADTTSTLFERLARLLVILPPGKSFSDTDPGQTAVEINSDGNTRTGLRVTGKVIKTNQKEPNTSEVVVYNLSPATRASLQVIGVRLVLEAGYAGTGLLPLFTGDVRIVDNVREGADWKTTFRCGDGERSYRYSRAGESFAAGVTVGDVVNYCASVMQIATGDTATQAAALSKVLYQGWTAHGSAMTELERVLRSVGYGCSIQDGVLQILSPVESVAQQVPDLTPETGLIGSPEFGTPPKKDKPKSLKAKALLMPQLRPGGRVSIRCERVSGVFKILKVVHDFDTRGGAWYSEIETVADGTARTA